MGQAAPQALARDDDERQPSGDGAAAREAATVLGGYLVLGVLGALLWWLLVDPAMFRRTEDGGVSMSELELAQRFNTDGWYTVIAGVLGMLSGAAATWWRSRDSLFTVALITVGSGLAATAMAWLGGVLGPADPRLVEVPVGSPLPAPLEVASPVCYLVWPIAVLIGSLLVLWSPPAGASSP